MIDKPQPGEYAEFAGTYVNLVNEGDVIQRLIDQQATSYGFFSSLSPEQADYAYAEGKWTIKEVLAHMIDSERVFAYRASSISRGEQQNLPGFDQDVYAAHANASQRGLLDLANEFKTLREANLYFVKALTTAQANTIGKANGNPASVRALVHIMAGHELHHLNILNERYL